MLAGKMPTSFAFILNICSHWSLRSKGTNYYLDQYVKCVCCCFGYSWVSCWCWVAVAAVVTIDTIVPFKHALVYVKDADVQQTAVDNDGVDNEDRCDNYDDNYDANKY